MNYSNGKIYRLIDNTNGRQYVGSSTQPLSKRLYQHKHCYTSYLKGTSQYCTSYEIIKNGNFEIVLIEKFPCKTKEELSARERHWVEQVDCVNKVKKVVRSCDEAKQYQQEYKENNKEKLKALGRSWREKNAEQKKTTDQIYYCLNRLNVLEKVKCECGEEVCKGGLLRHKKTVKHTELMKTVPTEI